MTHAEIPRPSDAVLQKLATIAVQAEEVLVADHERDKAPVGLRTFRNDRRRSMEQILILLADPELKSYLAEVREMVT